MSTNIEDDILIATPFDTDTVKAELRINTKGSKVYDNRIPISNDLETIIQNNVARLSNIKFARGSEHMEESFKELGFITAHIDNGFYFYPDLGGQKDIFTPSWFLTHVLSNAQRLDIDCSLYVSLIATASIRDYIGEEKFNNYFRHTMEEGVKMYEEEDLYMGAKFPGWKGCVSTSFKSTNESQAEARDLLSRVGVGTVITLTAKNPERLRNPGDSTNENIIKISNTDYAALGLGKNKVFTFDRIVEILNDSGTEYYVSSINEINYDSYRE